MVETVARLIGEHLGEQRGGGGIEHRVVHLRRTRMLGNAGLELGQVECDCRLDLLREIEVLTGGVDEERVDQVQSPEIVAGTGRHEKGNR